MQLSELRSATWKKFEGELRLRLDELRAQNDASANTPDQTALIRGRISEVKRLLALSLESARADDFPGHGEVGSSQQ